MTDQGDIDSKYRDPIGQIAKGGIKSIAGEAFSPAKTLPERPEDTPDFLKAFQIPEQVLLTEEQIKAINEKFRFTDTYLALNTTGSETPKFIDTSGREFAMNLFQRFREALRIAGITEKPPTPTATDTIDTNIPPTYTPTATPTTDYRLTPTPPPTPYSPTPTPEAPLPPPPTPGK